VDVVGDAKTCGTWHAFHQEKFNLVKYSVIGTWVWMFTCCREAAKTGCCSVRTNGLEMLAEEPLEEFSGLMAEKMRKQWLQVTLGVWDYPKFWVG
jgi:hypothetical protein